MVAPMDVRLKQRAVTEFLVLKGKTMADIYGRLQNVYKDLTLDFSSVYRWVRRVSDMSGAGDAGQPVPVSDYSLNTSLCDKARTGRP